MPARPSRRRLVPLLLLTLLVAAGLAPGATGAIGVTPASPATQAQAAPAQANGQLTVCGLKLCNDQGTPVQLRGMSTHGLQWYSQCVNDASMDALAGGWGASVVRLSMYIQEGGYETDPQGFTDQVSSLIDEATERGLYVIVDWHMLSPGDPHYNLDRAKTFFTEIAQRHNGNTNLLYEIANEPNGVDWPSIKSYAEELIPVIRQHDPETPVLVGTRAWSSLGVSDGADESEIVNDPVNADNIMYTFHFYAASHGDEYLSTLDRAADALPLFVTEFGTQEASGDGGNDFDMAQRYLDLLAEEQIGWTNWNFSDDSRSGAVFTEGTCPDGPFDGSSLKPAGTWIRDHISQATTPSRVIDVHNADELRTALSDAQPGDEIRMADGTYDGLFSIDRDGTAEAPITLSGSRSAVIDGGGTSAGRAVQLQADHWKLSGFTVTDAQKGIMALGAQHTEVDGVRVHHIGDEAIHFRDHSSDNVVRNSEISDTGLREPGYGEGVYFGQAKSNWPDGQPDNSDRNQALDNHFGPDVRAEAIDIKEGTTGGEVRGNTFDGTGMTGANYADSWLDVKGNDYLIADNNGVYALRDGYQTSVQLDGWGRGNVFTGNTVDLQADGFGFRIGKSGDDALGNVVCADNTVTNAGSGAANVELTQDCPGSR
ncbi:MAG: cellulase family glycosylhydrolase [Thermocrispum sp.]